MRVLDVVVQVALLAAFSYGLQKAANKFHKGSIVQVVTKKENVDLKMPAITICPMSDNPTQDIPQKEQCCSTI
jgi:hypothetical protein